VGDLTIKEFSLPAKLYIFLIMLLGVVLCFVQLPDLHGARLWLFLGVTILTCVTLINQVEGISKDFTYNASVFGYSLMLLALGRAEASWVVLISFVTTWIWRKGSMPWYSLGFNIGSATIPIAVAGLVYQFISKYYGINGFQGVIGIAAAGVVYIFLSQLISGLVFLLVDGKKLSDSGLLDRVVIIADATLFTMGALAALVWTINPFAIIFALSPLYLIYLTLQLPSLRLRANTDSKTGLYNTRYFNNALEKELQRSDRANNPLSIVMCDLDYLRNVNNTYGHLAGDVAIVTIASTIKKLVRNYDIVARFGGEEFAIIMPETTMERASVRVEEIRQAIESTVIELTTAAAPIRVTMSFGVAERESIGQKAGDIIQKADMALYEAKQSGRNKVCYYIMDGLNQRIVSRT
jgi:diguanylate cyclase (GGDEF)-like protein